MDIRLVAAFPRSRGLFALQLGVHAQGQHHQVRPLGGGDAPRQIPRKAQFPPGRFPIGLGQGTPLGVDNPGPDGCAALNPWTTV